jgi:hypothetical protein
MLLPIAAARPNAYGRSGFSIHGGKEPGSQGCIDLTNLMDDFAAWYQTQSDPLKLVVDYAYSANREWGQDSPSEHIYFRDGVTAKHTELLGGEHNIRLTDTGGTDTWSTQFGHFDSNNVLRTEIVTADDLSRKEITYDPAA